jgi:hypothetical protein
VTPDERLRALEREQARVRREGREALDEARAGGGVAPAREAMAFVHVEQALAAEARELRRRIAAAAGP